MGTIVQFAAQRSTGQRTESGRPCVITIFPGVRYERGADRSVSPPRPDADHSARHPDDAMG